jgi:hypothetical protein
MPRSKTSFGLGVVNAGSDYSEDEFEFIRAMERYQRKNRRPFPTCREVLQVLKSLGYRKQETEVREQKSAKPAA